MREHGWATVYAGAVLATFLAVVGAGCWLILQGAEGRIPAGLALPGAFIIGLLGSGVLTYMTSWGFIRRFL